MLAQVADSYVSAHPNAGLPNAFGEYDETPEDMAAMLRRVRAARACSTWSAAAAAPRRRTSRAIAEAVQAGMPPRCACPRLGACAERRMSARDPATPACPASSRWSITPERNFVNVGERTNVTGSRAVHAS